MPGKPAARVGDQTAHGGVITGPGVPMVLIGGQPAAVMGDMHACPMVNPGPPAIPHVGAAIIATGVMVLIGGKPAAVMGDTAICTGPPDAIVGGCPTVLIGSGGGGGGGAGSGGQQKAKAKKDKADIGENHYLDVKFEDKGGKPITGVKYTVKTPDGNKSDGPLAGQVKKSGLKQGNCEIELTAIVNAVWSKTKARVGDKVKLKAETAGIPDGEKATLEIFVKDANFADHLMKTIESKVDGGKIEAEWEFEIDEALLADHDGKKQKGAYISPKFYYVAKAAGFICRSGLLEYKDYVEIELRDEEDKPVKGAAYKMRLANGEIREGKLDANGYAKVDNVPPGRVEVEFEVDPGK